MILTIIERENHIYKLPDGFDLAKDDDNMYHFTYCLPNDDDGYGIGFRGPFDTILFDEEDWNHFKCLSIFFILPSEKERLKKNILTHDNFFRQLKIAAMKIFSNPETIQKLMKNINDSNNK